jgi:uncharacterized protein Usg
MPNTTVDPAFRKMARGYGLTTAEIFYRMPDYRNILQTFVWQDYDVFPEFPELQKFLRFWSTLDGPLHRVRVAHQCLIRPSEFKVVNGSFVMN